MTVNNLKRRVGAWVVMDIKEKQKYCASLIRIIGPIVESNFLEACTSSDMPVMAVGFEDIPIGTRVKLIFTTTLEELGAFRARRSLGFEDFGCMYFKQTDKGWEKFYDG